LVDEARAYAAKVVPEARGDAQRLRTTAEGYKTASVARATGDAERFTLLVDEYRNAPDVTRKRLWLETVQQLLAAHRNVVGGDGASGNVQTPLLPPEVVIPPSGTGTEATLPRPPRGSRGEGGNR